MRNRALLFIALLGTGFVSSRVSALTNDNLLTNPGFKTDLSGWEPFGNVVWSNNDVLGSVSSGSALITTR